MRIPALPDARKPAYNAGSHISTATTTTGLEPAMYTKFFRIAALVRFLHRTDKRNDAAGSQMLNKHTQSCSWIRLIHKNGASYDCIYRSNGSVVLKI